MANLKAIVALNKDGVIGLHNDLPWQYSGDLRWFREQTLHQTVIMGRNTWRSIGSESLPYRRNLVVSSRLANHPATECGAQFFALPGLALAAAGAEGAWVIGGGELYLATLPLCKQVVATYVPDRVSAERLPTYFPMHLLQDHFAIDDCKPHPYERDLTVVTYVRRQP